jgi:MFS family permease
MCISMFLFTTSFNLILPELNDFLTQLGGAGSKGLIILVFTISAAISRPFSGKLSDIIGRKAVMNTGIFICIVVCLLYPLSTTVWFFLLLRFFHGFCAGFMPTGATALVTDILPADKRGMGMGIWGTFISLGMGVGFSLGSVITGWLGLNALFMIASLFAVVSSILMFKVEETLVHTQKFKARHLRIRWTDIFEPRVLPAAIVMFLSCTCSGIILVLSAEISGFLHLGNKGWFFLFYVMSTIVVRLLAGKLSDRIGRRETLLIGMVLVIVSMLLIGYATNIWSYTISSVIFGLATGITSPTIFAWTADLSDPERRGVGSGTMFIALELGVMLGSFSTTLLYDNTFASIPRAFLAGTILSAVACIYLVYHLKYRKSST